LLKNAESNADAKNIDVEDLIIKNIVVQQAPVRKVELDQEIFD
jgi:large subunit ribosomal protein L17e